MTTSVAETASPADILRQGSAFCEAKALLSAVELGLFTALHGRDANRNEVCDLLGLHPRGTGDFLDLLVGLGHLQREAGRYRNAPAADRYLVRGKESYVGGFLERASHNLYPAWGRLTEALRAGGLQSDDDFREMIADRGRLERFVGMMDALTHMLGPELTRAFDWSAHRSVIDVGGARGNLLSQLLTAHPHLTGTVFDLPPMAPLFDQLMASLDLTGRARFVGGDFFADPLPQADVVVLGHVLHDWDEGRRRALIHQAHAAVRSGGALLVYDRMLDDEPTDVENLVISLDMLLITEGGSEYPASECVRHARDAGFTDVSVQPLADKDTLVVCRRP